MTTQFPPSLWYGVRTTSRLLIALMQRPRALFHNNIETQGHKKDKKNKHQTILTAMRRI